MSGSPSAEPPVAPAVLLAAPTVPDVAPRVPDVAPTVPDVLLERALPVPDPLADFFWVSGRDGVLRLLRCAECGYYVHPPSLPCPRCLSRDVRPEPVSGRAVVHSRTVNVQQWTPGQPPYVIAVVELVEQPGLRLTTNVVGCPPEEVWIDQPVRVAFVARDGLHFPVFVPAPEVDPTA
ncbi:MAG TPA: OB-fold domain-containing protein [Pseudonocardia sp.]|nr:OB-fold domain-containing protein [Pseudonocardia sp.]